MWFLSFFSFLFLSLTYDDLNIKFLESVSNFPDAIVNCFIRCRLWELKNAPWSKWKFIDQETWRLCNFGKEIVPGRTLSDASFILYENVIFVIELTWIHINSWVVTKLCCKGKKGSNNVFYKNLNIWFIKYYSV